MRLKQKLGLAMYRRRFLSGSPPDVVSTVEHLLAALSGER
jgi:UDP-3-O-acyl-N-acetylglucosamine deacetylase